METICIYLAYIIGGILLAFWGLYLIDKSKSEGCLASGGFLTIAGGLVSIINLLFCCEFVYLIYTWQPFNEYYYDKLLEDDCSIFTVQNKPKSTVYTLRVGDIQPAIKVEVKRPDLVYSLKHGGKNPEPEFDYLNGQDDHLTDKRVIWEEVKAMSLGKIKKYIERR